MGWHGLDGDRRLAFRRHGRPQADERMMIVNPTVLDWMLDSDPALRWQVERDLARAPDEVWQTTRARVATEGSRSAAAGPAGRRRAVGGRRVLSRGLDRRGRPRRRGRPAVHGDDVVAELAARMGRGCGGAGRHGREARRQQPVGVREPALLGRRGRRRINSFTLANGVWLGADVEKLADWFLEHQMDDGGWNCAWGTARPCRRSTRRSTRCAGCCRQRERVGRHRRAARCAARRRGVSVGAPLMRRLSTGEPVGPWVTTLAYPFRWRYSELNRRLLRAASARTAPRPIRAWRRRSRPFARPANRRHLAAGSPASRARGVRSTCARAAVEMADVHRDARARVVDAHMQATRG